MRNGRPTGQPAKNSLCQPCFLRGKTKSEKDSFSRPWFPTALQYQTDWARNNFSFSFGKLFSLLPTAFRMNKIPFPSLTGKIPKIQEICFKISMQRKMRNEKNPFSLHFPYRQQPLLAFLDSIWSARFLRQAACAFWHYIRLHYIFGECGF